MRSCFAAIKSGEVDAIRGYAVTRLDHNDEYARIENGKVVGLTTSGAQGVRTGLTLALALVQIAPGETAAETAGRNFAVDVAGTPYPARVLARPPHDPHGERMSA